MPPQNPYQTPQPGQTPLDPQPGSAPNPYQQPGQQFAAPSGYQPQPVADTLPQPLSNQPLQQQPPVSGQPYQQPPLTASLPPGQQPTYNPPGSEANHTYGIIGLVLAFIFWPAGLVFSILALKKSHESRGLAIAGIVVNGLFALISIGVIVAIVSTASSGIQQKSQDSQDSKYRTDLKTINSNIEASKANSGSYPTLAQLNDESWRTTNTPGLDPQALSPNSSQTQLAADTPTTSAYAYTTYPADCQGTAASPCTSFSLGALSSTNKIIVQNSVN